MTAIPVTANQTYGQRDLLALAGTYLSYEGRPAVLVRAYDSRADELRAVRPDGAEVTMHVSADGMRADDARYALGPPFTPAELAAEIARITGGPDAHGHAAKPIP